MNDMSVHIGEAEVASGVVVGEALVIEAQEMENGGLKVVDVNLSLSDVEAEVVGFTVGAGLGAAAGHEGGEGLRVVIASRFATQGWIGFDHGSAAEFATPDDEGFVEEAVAFEILNERGGGLRGSGAVTLGRAFDVGMGVPSGVVDIDEADAALDHASGEEAGTRKGMFAALAPVEIDRFIRLGFQVHQFRCGRLKAGRHFVGRHAGSNFLVADGFESLGVELIDEIEGVALKFGRDSFGRRDIEDGILAFAELNAGVGGGEEAGRPESRATRESGSGGHHNEGGEVVAFGAEPVERPRTKRGASGLREAGVEEELGRGVVELVGGAGFDDAEVVGDGPEGGEGRAEGGAAVAILIELELWSENGGVGLDEGVSLIADDGLGERGAFQFGEVGFGVEEFKLGWGAGHEEVDDGFRFGLGVSRAWFEAAPGKGVGEKAGGGNLAKTDPAFAEEVAAGEWVLIEHGTEGWGLVLGDRLVEREKSAGEGGP